MAYSCHAIWVRRHCIVLQRGQIPPPLMMTIKVGLTVNSRPSNPATRSKATVAIDVDVDDNTKTRSSRTPMTTGATAMNFADPASAHGSKSTAELLRAISVFYTCRIPFVVQQSETLLKLFTKVFGPSITDVLLKMTFFGHFCAGEDSENMRPVIDKLMANGVGPILDYAAEAEGDGLVPEQRHNAMTTRPPFNQPARVYDYTTEEECDKHVDVFLSCIRSVRDISEDGKGFAAIKVTALGNPELLERMSTIITEVKNLFGKFDLDRNGMIRSEEFMQCYEEYFHVDNGIRTEIFTFLQADPSYKEIDFISFSKLFTPYNIGKFTYTCKDVGPLALATPSADEVALMRRTSERLHTLAEEAAKCGAKLLIDAEHRKYQPAIDNLVLELQRKYNAKSSTNRPVIFNTYQCYLKDSKERAITDLKRSERFNFHFAAKLVRGAYMLHERERAKTLNIEDPIHETAVATHRNYDEVVEHLLRYRSSSSSGPGLEIMVASHNETSIRNAIGIMNELGLDPDDECVHFAQLLGMSDHLTFTLGRAGYSTYKYLPYGKVSEVVPYLIRRAQENGDVLGNTGTELSLLHKELRRRVLFSV